MRGSSGMWLLMAALLGLAAAGWLVLGNDRGEEYGDEYDAVHAAVADEPGALMLAGHARSANVTGEPGAQHSLRGTVTDAQGKPVAGVKVTARVRSGSRVLDGFVGRDLGSRLRWQFAELAQPVPLAQPDALTTSGEDGAFTLTLGRAGQVEVRAEPEPPQVGTLVQVGTGQAARERIELRVLAGSPIHGRVLDAEGRGVATTLRANWYGEDLGSWTGGPVATDAASGGFRFAAVPAGAVSLELLLSGRTRYTARVVAAPTDEEIVIRLDAEVPLLTGRVVSLGGHPVAGALVVASLQSAKPLTPQSPPAAGVYVRYFAESGMDGTFVMVGALGGALTGLEAVAAGFLDHSSSPPLAPWSGAALARTPAGPLEIVLFQGGTVEGRVAEKGSGKPLADVRLQTQALALDARVSHGGAPATATTDAQGRYRIEGVPLGRNVLIVQHPTHYLTAQAQGAGMPMMYHNGMPVYMPGGGGAQGPTVFIESEGQRVTRDLELEVGVAIQGQVLGPDGAPVEGAQIMSSNQAQGGMRQASWVHEEGQNASGQITSDAKGRFRILGLPPSKSMTLTARKKPWIGVRSEPFTLATDAPTKEIVLRLEKGGSIAGSVVDERGIGVRGAHINAWSETGNDSSEGGDNKSGADGAFRLEGLGPGTWHVSAWLQDGRQAQGSIQGLAAGEAREGLTLRLLESVRLSGVLVDEQGQPLTHKELMLIGPQGGASQAYSGSDGAFTFSGVAKGTQQVFAGGWNGPRLLLGTFEAPASDVRVVYKEPPHAVIEGTVLDAQGRSVPLCTVRIRTGPAAAPASSGAPMHHIPTPAGPMEVGGQQLANGWFRMRVSGEPPFQVSVSAPQNTEGRPLNLRGTTVTVADPRAGPLTIRLEPGLEVAGRVLDGGGRAVPDVAVGVAGLNTTTDAEGAFAVGGLAEGTHKVQVLPQPPFVRPAETSAIAGTRDLVLRLTTGLPIAGSMRRADGQPIPQGWVSAQWPAASGASAGQIGANPDAQGRFRLEGVPPDVLVTVTAQAWSASGGSTLAPRTLKGVRPGTEDLELILGAGASVSGTVADARGKPVGGGLINIARVGPDSTPQTIQHIQVAEAGTFEMSGLEPGPVVLTYLPQDGGVPGEALRTEAPVVGVHIVVPERTPIRGRLSGQGTAPGPWQVWGWSVEEPTRRVRGTVNTEGDFTLAGVSGKGPWMVAARSDADDRYALAGPVEGGTEGVRLELRAGRSIEGFVQAQPGSPHSLAGLRVDVSGAGFNARVMTDATGAFVVRGLPPGRYSLIARGPDRQHGEPVKDVADGATAVRLLLKN